MDMLSKIWSSKTKPVCAETDSVSHNQAIQETLSLGMECGVYVEENKVCRCGQEGVIGVDQHTDSQADSSFAHAVINMIGMLIGLGQLSTPYALENGGWASSFLLIGVGIMCGYTSHLLGKCLDKNPESRSYTDIGQHAFGTKGKIISAIFIYLEIFMSLVSYTISLHDNITTVFTGTHFNWSWLKLSPPHFLTTIAVLVALPSLWLRDLSSISFLSTGGIFMSLVIFASVAFTAIFGGIKANQSIPVLRVHKIPAISGLYVFAYSGHFVFPDLYKSMKDPSKFTKVSMVSFAAVTAPYTSLAFMGAKLFGRTVSSQITLSMPRHLVVTKIALWATVLTPMTKYALEFATFATQLEHALPPSLTSRTKMIIRGTVGSILLLIILMLALCVPYFEHVLGLTGSMVSISIAVILPCAFYLKIFGWSKLGKPVMVLNFVLIVFGVAIGVIGTYYSSKSIVATILKVH